MLFPGGLLLNYSAQKFSRRKFLAATLALPSSNLINTKNMEELRDNTSNEPSKPPVSSKNNSDSKHLAWVWQFQHDGDRELIRDILSEYQLGLVIKTNDGIDWMSSYDTSKDAISGPRSIEKLATFLIMLMYLYMRGLSLMEHNPDKKQKWLQRSLILVRNHFS